MMKLAELRKIAAQRITEPLIAVLARSRLKPNTLTWLALATSVIAAGTIVTNHLLISGVLVLLSGVLDILDGTLARLTSQTTRFGALLDSTFDRISEAVVLLGLLVLYARDGGSLEVVLVFSAMVSSFLTSYIRARAEGLGIDCPVGLFTRTERVIILALGLLLGQFYKFSILIALLVLAVFGFITVCQRLVYVWQQIKTQ
ncbi:MAG TPA: CDP-alcohol phosphatidyltransferase family protein [Dehalococcoidia bacterium]|nr:CDP-alcohol phosphatidyltransferase family protein [Dehalococcoidia bacterium]